MEDSLNAVTVGKASWCWWWVIVGDIGGHTGKFKVVVGIWATGGVGNGSGVRPLNIHIVHGCHGD